MDTRREKTWRTFFIPDRHKVVVFGAFIILTLAAGVQSWVFCKECAPKPLLFDLLRFFPFWPVAMMTLVPIYAVSSLIALVLGQPADPPPIIQAAPEVQLAAAVIYYYLLSCAIVGFWKVENKGTRLRSMVELLGTFLLMLIFSIGLHFTVALIVVWPLSLLVPNPIIGTVVYWILELLIIGGVVRSFAKREQWRLMILLPLAYLLSFGFGPMD